MKLLRLLLRAVAVIGATALCLLALSYVVLSSSSKYVRAHWLEAFRVPSSSMVPTIIPGDHILVVKGAYSNHEPMRGDVVLLTLPDDPRTPDYDESAVNIIRRIIALPQETIAVQGTTVIIDDKPLNEPYARWDLNGAMSMESVRVPPGAYFVLGDNRDHSKDSRYYPGRFIARERIKGRAAYIYYNVADVRRIGLPVH